MLGLGLSIWKAWLGGGGGAFAWILATGSWSDIGIWDDAENWEDS